MSISEEELAIIFGDISSQTPKQGDNGVDAEMRAELERALAEDSLPVLSTHPAKLVAEAVLSEFLQDKHRLRTRHVGGEWLGFVITSKPLPSAPTGSPIWHAGLEPFAQIQFADSARLLFFNGRALTASRTTTAFEHTVWIVRVGEGQLVRVWARERSALSNQRALFWSLAPSGDAKQLEREDYDLRRYAPQGASHE